jgi:ankyrin repeat protein/lipoprotein NlpI
MKFRLTPFVITLFILLSMLVVVSGQSPQNDAATLIAEAKSLWKKNDLEHALATITRAISADQRNPAAYVQLALIHASMNHDDQARLAVEEALKIDPNYPPAHQQRAAQLRRAKDYEGAIREAKLALSLKPDAEFAAYSHLTLASTYEERKQYDEALNEYREATRSNPGDGSLYVDLGSALFSLKRYGEAESAFQRAVEIDSQNSNAVINLAASLHNQGKKDEAIRYYQEYLRLEPQASDRASVEQRISELQRTPQPLLLNQLLLLMAEDGDLANVSALITRGADPNFQSSYDYQTPLGAAARKSHIEVVKLLLSRGAKDPDGAAITNAYEGRHAEVERVLQNAQPLTPKALNRLLNAAISRGDAAKAQAMITGGADGLDAALDLAVDQDKPLVETVQLLLDKGARVNQPDAYRTPLMLAADKGHLEIVKLLLAKGADVNAIGKEDMTALRLAVRQENAAVVSVLLAAGADLKGNYLLHDAAGVFKRVEEGQVPKQSSEVLQLLLDKGANAKSPDGDSALLVADSAEKVKLLLAHGANPNARGEYGRTPLLAAADERDAESVAVLLGSGADVNAKDSQGDTALLQALNGENYQGSQKRVNDPVGVVGVLLRAKNVDVNAQNKNGETALMRAVRLGDAESVRLLLAARADVNAADVIGDTAFTLAYAKGDTGIENLLARAAPEKPDPRTLNAFLVAAIDKKDAAKVKELLDKGADPNHRYSIGLNLQGTTSIVLVQAAKVGHAGIVQMLLDKGADVNAKGLLSGSESGLIHGTALEAAKDPEVIAVLKRAMNKKN